MPHSRAFTGKPRPFWSAAFAFLLVPALLPAQAEVRVWTEAPIPVVIDPGHGGADTKRKDDKYDPVSRDFLDAYAAGTSYGAFTEQELVLALGKRVRFYLDLTKTDDGWKQFTRILSTFSTQKEFKRLRFDASMSREDSWLDRGEKLESPDVNALYRLYDSIDSKGNTRLGRISVVNQTKPYLTVALHLNPADRGNPGGMAAVLAPGFSTFELLRLITLKKKAPDVFLKTPWHAGWLIMEPGWSKFESARADAWVYFHGYRSLKDGSAIWKDKYRGLRQNMVTWRYRDPDGWEEKARAAGPGPYAVKYAEFRAEGAFWEREKGKAEQMRREGGPLGFGGDNHYASDELLRYIQYGLRAQVPDMRKPGKIGDILVPFVSTYSLPTFTNSICAYLEVGHLNIDRDRALVTERREETARSLAVGIYSLFAGLKLRENPKTVFRPRGQPIDFNKYVEMPGGNYFDTVLD